MHKADPDELDQLMIEWFKERWRQIDAVSGLILDVNAREMQKGLGNGENEALLVLWG